MLNRWCNEVNSINLAFFNLKRICRKSNILKGGRGRKPKREIEGYAFLISLKEFDKRKPSIDYFYLAEKNAEERRLQQLIHFNEGYKTSSH